MTTAPRCRVDVVFIRVEAVALFAKLIHVVRIRRESKSAQKKLYDRGASRYPQILENGQNVDG